MNINTLIGVDIGYEDIKFVQFKRQRTNDDWSLQDCRIIELKVAAAGKEKNRKIIEALKNFFKDLDLNKTKIVCVVNDIETIEKRILTPLMSKHELEQAIRWKIKDFISFPLEEACIDFKIIGKTEIEGETKDEILAVAFPKKTINRYYSLFKRIKVFPCLFLSSASCIEHSLSRLEVKEDETLAFIDLGATQTELLIFRNSNYLYQ